ncbi:MAG TPA: EAL domain-containing protein [Solirubrobacterales bacterium]|jgi:diguanylate cyclase (GGDEF)-like protein
MAIAEADTWGMSPPTAMRRLAPRPSEPPRLVRRFALYAGLALVLAAAAAFVFVRGYATRHAERTAIAHTEYVADSVLPSVLRRSDFAGPARGPRLRRLDRISRRQLLTDGALRVKLYAPSGRVVYSTAHDLIGTNPDADEIAEVLDGEPVSDVSSLNAEGGHGPDRTILETYTPVQIGGGEPVGVFEIYDDYAPIASDARGIFIPIAAGIAIVLLGLYLSFFPILKRVTRTLRGQMREIEHKAYHDDLTDLPNRMLFNERALEAVAEANERGSRLAVMLIDIDRFKDVNDTLGHASGDRLLRELAAELPHQMRHGDTVARLGGDEFGILAREIRDPSAVLALAQKARDILSQPRMIDGIELAVDASIGIALLPEHGTDVETLFRRADVAMYHSKEVHAPVLYESEHDHYSPARLALIGELHRAISKDELVVDYQPQCDPASGELRGVEALVRWQHPRRGLLMPEEFIPLAEHTGLIRELTRFVLDTSLRQCADWRRDGLDVSVAVNISARDIVDSRFPEDVERLLDRHSIDPGCLELEITEKTALSDLPRARAILFRLSDLGVRLAIDDFGTGNSSLAYFRRLPVDVLKIDRSYVTRMLENKDDAAIVNSTVRLAHDLGLQVVAEGVEDAECSRHLVELGCELAQGFYFGRPMPAGDVAGHRVPS